MTRYEQPTAASQNLTYNRAKERATIYRKGKRGGMGCLFYSRLVVLVPQVSVVLLFNVDEQKALGDRQGSQVWLMRGVKLGPDTRHNPRGTRGGWGLGVFF